MWDSHRSAVNGATSLQSVWDDWETAYFSERHTAQPGSAFYWSATSADGLGAGTKGNGHQQQLWAIFFTPITRCVLTVPLYRHYWVLSKSGPSGSGLGGDTIKISVISLRFLWMHRWEIQFSQGLQWLITLSTHTGRPISPCPPF